MGKFWEKSMKFFYILKVTEERSRIQELDPEPGSISQTYGSRCAPDPQN
jgi:hypothetical protein